MTLNKIISNYIDSVAQYGYNSYLSDTTKAYLLEKTNNSIMTKYIRQWSMDDVISILLFHVNNDYTRKLDPIKVKIKDKSTLYKLANRIAEGYSENDLIELLK